MVYSGLIRYIYKEEIIKKIIDLKYKKVCFRYVYCIVIV